MNKADYNLDFLLSLNGQEFEFAAHYKVKIKAHATATSQHRPHGVKYSLTLHDKTGRRLHGIDNAHGIGRRVVFYHRHVYGNDKVIVYMYRGSAELLEGFYRDVERIIKERGHP